jgi:hypothetical protein
MGHSPNVQLAYKRILKKRESQQTHQTPDVDDEDEEEEEEEEEEEVKETTFSLAQLEDFHSRLQREQDEVNEALERENNERRKKRRQDENDNLFRLQIEDVLTLLSDTLRAERERNHPGQPEPKKRKRSYVKKRKETTDIELPPRKISRKVTL